jgi:hypothetical protein
VRGLIQAWQRREIDGVGLMRGLVSFDKWMVPVTQAAAGDMLGGEPPRIAFSVDDQGVRRLLIFSSSEAYDALRTRLGPAAPPEQHFLSTTGTWVFAAPAGSFDWIVVDPSTEWEIAYGADHLPRLAQTAAAVSAERALAALRSPSGEPDPSSIPTVRDHPGYILAVIKEGEQVRLALAPDPQGRVLAAVFTHDDCFDAFASGVGGGLMMLNLPGRQLFEQLAETQLDGIVFNPAGPPAPVAFAAAFSRVILESGG